MKKLVIFFLLNFYCLSVYACDEDQFNRYLDDGNDTEAYELLEECEPLKNLSVDTLERIGAFYIRTDVINFPSENYRAKKGYEAYFYAALQGSRWGISMIQSLLEFGEEDLSLEWQKEKAQCLYPYTDLDEEDEIPSGIVELCLGGSDISILGL